MATVKVSKAQATNKTTGRLKKGFKATKSGYYKVTASKAKPKKAKRKTKRKTGIKSKIKGALKKLKLTK